jgi:hypothetical protein
LRAECLCRDAALLQVVDLVLQGTTGTQSARLLKQNCNHNPAILCALGRWWL